MTQLTDEQYSRWAAEKVCKERYHKGARGVGYMGGEIMQMSGSKDKCLVGGVKFDPRNNAEQALCLLEKWIKDNPMTRDSSMRINHLGVTLLIFDDDTNKEYRSHDQDFAKCICAAIYQAVEGE